MMEKLIPYIMKVGKINIVGGTVNFVTPNNGKSQTGEKTEQHVHSTTGTDRAPNRDRDIHVVNKNSKEEFDPLVDIPRCFKINAVDLAAE